MKVWCIDLVWCFTVALVGVAMFLALYGVNP